MSYKSQYHVPAWQRKLLLRAQDELWRPPFTRIEYKGFWWKKDRSSISPRKVLRGTTSDFCLPTLGCTGNSGASVVLFLVIVEFVIKMDRPYAVNELILMVSLRPTHKMRLYHHGAAFCKKMRGKLSKMSEKRNIRDHIPFHTPVLLPFLPLPPPFFRLKGPIMHSHSMDQGLDRLTRHQQLN
ncbi:hypothetical protein NE237_001955 [Protea cynaroides]|uniref:Uncharacterized protein n=1 Tax=Protea cynaroides TaxID=273540 RepID=A0A9Q0KUI6_9MAGN|nr:hypothetical protein NE237_001955 [Protea cynaroides]